MSKKVILASVIAAQMTTVAWAASPPADGIKLYNQGKYLPASQAILAALKTNKNPAMTPTFYYYLGCCYYQSKQSAEATKIYRYIETAFPGSDAAKMAATMLSKLAPAAGSTSSSTAPVDPDNPSDKDVKAVVAAMAAGKGSDELSPAALRVLQAATKNSGLATAGSSSSKTRESPNSRGASQESSKEISDLPATGKFNFQRTDSGHMAVVCYINNSPVNCWFDTGAGAHFGMNHLREAGIDIAQAKPAGTTHGWAGRPVPIWRMVANVKLGNVTRKIPITIEENMTLSPLIGQDFVEGFQYEIDDKAGVVNLRNSFSGEGDKQTVNSMYDIPCRRDGRDDVIDLTVNGRKCEAFIDTGASFTIMNPATAAKLGIEVPADAETMSITGVGGSTRVRIAYLDMRLGPIHKPEFRVLIGGEAGNCVGQDFMQGWRVKIDREKNLLRFFH